MSLPQARIRSFSEESMKGVQGKMQQVEDHGPYYAYTPGEPLHRVDERDGVPHVYPHYVRIVESSYNLKNAELSVERWAFTTQSADGKPMFANPRYAGDIITNITRNYGHLGTISIQAFAKREPDEIDLDLFNRLIMPEPVWYERAEVPDRHLEVWRRRNPELIKRAKERGGLNVRAGYVGSALAELGQIDARLRGIYTNALVEVQGAIERFRDFAINQLSESDRHVKDRETSGKGTYDERDRRWQWLLGSEYTVTPEMGTKQSVTVNVPQTAVDDIQRQACATCGELIALTAKKCRYCGELVIVQTEEERLNSQIAAGVEAETKRRKTLAEKQAEARQRNGK